MYRDYAIMREAGPRARRGSQYGYARPRRVAVVKASGQLEALGDFHFDRYLSGHGQYAGARFEWTTDRRYPDGWREWNGTDDPGTRGRHWRLAVTLRNGRNEHVAYFEAWDERS